MYTSTIKKIVHSECIHGDGTSRVLFVLCLIIISLHSFTNNTVNAAVYYLDNSATGANNGNPGNDAWQSIAACLSALNALADNGGGDTVYVSEGTGTSYGDFIFSSPRTEYLDFRAIPGETPTFRRIVIGNNSNLDAYLRFYGIKVYADQSIGQDTPMVHVNSANNVEFHNNEWFGHERYDGIAPEIFGDNFVINASEIHYSTSYGPSPTEPGYKSRGINIFAGQNFLIKDCNIHDMSSTGINVGPGTSGTIDGCLIHSQQPLWPGFDGTEEGKHGSGIGICSSNVTIRNNVIHSCGNSGGHIFFYTSPHHNITIENNLLYDGKGFGTQSTSSWGRNGKFNNNIIVTNWQSAIPSTSPQRYARGVSFRFDNYQNDFEFYNNIIIGYMDTDGTDISGESNNNIVYSFKPTLAWTGTPLWVNSGLGSNSVILNSDVPGYGWMWKDMLEGGGWDPEQDFFVFPVFDIWLDNNFFSWSGIVGDFNIKDTSPAIGFADGLSSIGGHAPATDLLGKTRDASPDTGCYEYVLGSPDTTAPTIISVTVLSPVHILFSEPLDVNSATNTSNYNINPNITIYSATLQQDLQTVVLTTSDHSKNVKYTLTVNGVKDLSGNSMTETTINYEYTDGLVGHWKFDDGSGNVAIDSSGNNNIGTLINGPTWTTGKINGALRFDGINDYVDIGAQDIAYPWTASFWVKREDSSNSNAALLDSSDYSLKLEQYPNLNNVGFSAYGVADYSFNYEAPIGTWSHLVFLATQTQVTLYVNGVLTDTIANSISCPMAQISSSSRPANGTIDEVCVYNRALSMGEILELYNIGASNPVIVDHTAVEQFDQIPDYWIEKVKQDRMLVQYVGESHSMQLHLGLEALEAIDPKYAVQLNSDLYLLTETNALRVLRSQYETGSWGSGWSPVGEEAYWANETARLLTESSVLQAINQDGQISLSLFAWCWDVIKPSACYDENNIQITFNDERRDAYLAAIARFNNNPTINQTTFVYLTAVTDDDYFNPVDYIGPDGWRVTRYNDDIRAAAIANNGVLFDQADIENWNNDNTEQRIETWDGHDLYLMHADYNKNNPPDTHTSDHANDALGIRKAKAFWWMMARLAGWDGNTGVPSYDLSISTSGNGSVTKTPDKASYNNGEEVILQANPNTGYNFTNWSGDLSGSRNPATVVMNTDKSVTANFTPNTYYTITASGGGGGQINPNGTTQVFSGSSQAYTISANAGYHIADVLVDGNSVGAVSSYTFTNVTANHTIATTFAVNTFTIVASAGNGGQISPSGSLQFVSGGSQLYTISANTGYHIADVLVDGGSVGAVSSYNFTNITANHTIAATFAVNTYTITASAGNGGQISPVGTTQVNAGDSQIYTFTANAGYHVANVLVDGGSIGAVSSYTFSNVTRNHTISASFDIDETDVTAPTVTNLSPQADYIQSPLNSLITLHITDSGDGVDAGSVTIQVNNNLAYSGDTAKYSSAYGECYRTGTEADYTFIYQSNERFNFNQEITITVNAKDLAGNVMDEYSYSFQTKMRSFGKNKKINKNKEVDGDSVQPAGSIYSGGPTTCSDSEGNIWVAWHSGATGNKDIYVNKLAAGARDFGDSIKLTNSTADQRNPAIAIGSDDKLYVAWQDSRNGNWDIYVSTSTDGVNWSAKTRVTDSNDNQINPAIIIDRSLPNNAYIAWEDSRNGNQDIYIGASSNGFVTTTASQITSDLSGQVEPTIAVDSDNTVYVVWTDRRNSGNNDIYGAASNSGPWTNIPIVTEDESQSSPVIATEAVGSILHLAWVDDRAGGNDIYYAKTSGSLPTSPLTGSNIIDEPNSDQKRPAIAVDGSTGSNLRVFVCWEDDRNGDNDLYLSEVNSGSGTNVFVGDDGTNTDQTEPAIGIDGYGQPYLVWVDSRNMNADIYYAGSTFVEPDVFASGNVSPSSTITVGTALNAIDSIEDVSVEVPQGAYPCDIMITISKVQNSQEFDFDRFGGPYEFGPSGIDFDIPVTITIPYEVSGTETISYTAYWYNPLTNSLSQQGITDIETVVISPTLHALRFKTSHFTQFLIGGNFGGSSSSYSGGGGGGGGCSMSSNSHTSAAELLLPYLGLIVAMIVLKLRDRRKRKTCNAT